MGINDLYLRQVDILDPKKCTEEINIIGAGATGSFLALALAKMGMQNIKIFDDDIIEEHNFPNQLFPLKSLGKNKATETKRIVYEYTETSIIAVPHKYKQQKMKGIVISALDTMEGRALILNNCKGNKDISLIIDPRTGAEVIIIYTLNPNRAEEIKEYETSLFPDSEADNVPCTARSIIYTVLFVSGAVANIVKKYVMEEKLDEETIIDVKNMIILKK